MIPDQEIYLVLCQVSKGFGIKSFFYSASKLWNSLSPNLQHVTNKYLFKRNVKAYLWEKLLAVDQDDYIYF